MQWNRPVGKIKGICVRALHNTWRRDNSERATRSNDIPGPPNARHEGKTTPRKKICSKSFQKLLALGASILWHLPGQSLSFHLILFATHALDGRLAPILQSPKRNWEAKISLQPRRMEFILCPNWRGRRRCRQQIWHKEGRGRKFIFFLLAACWRGLCAFLVAR